MTSVNVTSNPYSVTVDSTGTSVTIASVAASATSGTVTSVTPAGDNGSGTAITGAGTITVAATAPISTSVSGTTITVTHDNASGAGTSTNYPGAITVNATGHVTGVGSTATPVLPTNNLSDVANAGTARTNLGLGTAAVVDTGTGDANVILGNDSRLTDDRDPNAHSAAKITSGTLAVARGGTGVTSLPMVTIPGAADAAAARTVLGVTNVGSYTGQIETAADKTYTIDPGAATARTITGFFIKSASGTVTATLKNGSDTVKAASVTDSTGDQTSLTNTSLSANGVLTLVTTSNSSALDVIFAVEYTE